MSLTMPTTSPVPISAQCNVYTTLDDSWRKMVNRRPAGPGHCDLHALKPGWYRFEGEAGTRLPTKAPGSE